MTRRSLVRQGPAGWWGCRRDRPTVAPAHSSAIPSLARRTQPGQARQTKFPHRHGRVAQARRAPCAPRCPESDRAKLQNHGARPWSVLSEVVFCLLAGACACKAAPVVARLLSGEVCEVCEETAMICLYLWTVSMEPEYSVMGVDAAVFVLLGCREVVSPSMGSQRQLIGTMVVVNSLDGLGRTQMIYTILDGTFPGSLGPVIRGDQLRCGRTHVGVCPISFLKEQLIACPASPATGTSQTDHVATRGSPSRREAHGCREKIAPP